MTRRYQDAVRVYEPQLPQRGAAIDDGDQPDYRQQHRVLTDQKGDYGPGRNLAGVKQQAERHQGAHGQSDHQDQVDQAERQTRSTVLGIIRLPGLRRQGNGFGHQRSNGCLIGFVPVKGISIPDLRSAIRCIPVF